ncbi:neuropeptide Y receptor type 5 [Anopheles cruzii]|uniref:neuropeptide Y receptor type 5 n=1 Tax=Anopheles cruzii TaxID=68878 RepID=UPI0022EC1E4D|nr:neuropeptide Y receptor type 5 [Anopheles cruzii]
MVGYWEHSLKNLSSQQRTIFTVFAILVMVIAVFGNVVTIITNVRREQRHLFRVCLLSLAFSDIAFVTVTSIVYLSQFNTEFNSLWTLGEMMCTFSPFVQTVAVLVNSITLVAIALDRYMALLRLAKGSWEPSGWFCFTCAVLIWGLGAGISSPMLTLYQVFDIIVLTADSAAAVTQPNPPTISGYYLAEICATDKSKNSYYFAIVFAVIFVPLLCAFCWLNGVIAKEFWKRRNPVAAKRPKPTSTSGGTERNTTVTTNTAVERRSPAPAALLASKCTCPHHQVGRSGLPANGQPRGAETDRSGEQKNENTLNRRKRQLRMFKAIVVLMLVFFVCRLPMWIFLLIKMMGDASSNAFWSLHYSFGLLAMLNGVLNPLMYTFLSETIRFTLFVKAYCVRVWMKPCLGGRGSTASASAARRAGAKERDSNEDSGLPGDADGGIYMG